LFGVGGDDPDEGEQNPQKNPPQTDSVEISSEAVELYQREAGKVTLETADGKLEIEFERVTAMRVEQQQGKQVKQADPLVIDLDGDGVELTDVSRDRGVSFDLTGDGKNETASWVAPDDGLLVLDRNGNGTIDGGRELFGDQNGAADGFAELSKFDQDLNGSIDQNDAVYQHLKVWRDLNQNGQSEQDELKSLAGYGISSIGLQHDATYQKIAGNTVAGYGSYTDSSRTGRIGEVLLNYLA
jgi:hypothetical protein